MGSPPDISASGNALSSIWRGGEIKGRVVRMDGSPKNMEQWMTDTFTWPSETEPIDPRGQTAFGREHDFAGRAHELLCTSRSQRVSILNSGGPRIGNFSL